MINEAPTRKLKNVGVQ